VKWYRDKFTGKTMNRPGWQSFESDLRAGRVARLAVWRLDRLGRTTIGLCQLFAECQARKVDLVSLRDRFSLDTPSGRHFARMMASQAEYDNEVRSENIRAGQAVARKQGKRWGGSQAGVRKKITSTQERVIQRMKDDGESIVAIAKTVNLSRPTIYDVLKVNYVVS
jgi:DNA invertase Pin-like site-specific DNA recombinase